MRSPPFLGRFHLSFEVIFISKSSLFLRLLQQIHLVNIGLACILQMGWFCSTIGQKFYLLSRYDKYIKDWTNVVWTNITLTLVLACQVWLGNSLLMICYDNVPLLGWHRVGMSSKYHTQITHRQIWKKFQSFSGHILSTTDISANAFLKI